MKLKITVLAVLSAGFSYTQDIDNDVLKKMRLRNIGPAGMSGRVTSIDVVRDNPEIIYAATASGGLWKSTSAGLKWKPIFDDQPTSSVGAVEIDPSNSDILWAGTGEGNPRNSHTEGGGIYRSLDAGHSWELMGLKNSHTIHRIIVDPTNSDIVYAASLGSAWGPSKERGVFKTTDGGQTWRKILYVNDTTGCADLVMDPSNPNKLIAAMWHHVRKPWTFTSGGEGSGMYITYDGGKTWKEKTDKHGLPKGELGRMGLAISPSDPNIIYALIESKKTALYKSTDGGIKFHKIQDKQVGNRPFYYADIFVDPKNPNRLFNLYSVVDLSEDGGRTFRTILPYGRIHPDHHAFYIHPDNPDFLIDGNDGGLNISRDGGKTWRFAGNLPLGQFYHINVDDDIPYNIYGGMQDNGSWVGPSSVWEWGPIKNHHWQEVLFGDGFDCMPSATNNRYGYAMYQGGSLSYFDIETGRTRSIQPVHPDGKELRFNWNAALAQDPHNKSGVYFGSQHVHYSTDQGKSWDILSPDLTTNDSTKQKQVESGGLTIDATKAENFTTILCISPDQHDKNVIWAGTDDGNLQLTKDRGETWTNLTDRLPDAPEGAWIPQIVVSPHDAGEAFVVINDYRRNNWSPYLYHTKDYGKKWTRIVRDGQVNGHCLSVIQDPEVENLLFLGTEMGLYFSIDYGKNWQKWNKEFPSVPVRDMKIQEREADLVLGTFGRAAWIVDDITPLRELAENNWIESEFRLFKPSTAGYQVASGQPAGERFGGDTEFGGQNEWPQVNFQFWVKEPGGKNKGKGGKEKDEEKDQETDKEKNEAVDWKKAIVRIRDMEGDTIRTYKVNVDTGLNQASWRMDRKGVYFPSRKLRNEDADEPGGPQVVPGEYELLLQYGTYMDSAKIRVKFDPRLEYNEHEVAAAHKMRKDLDSLIAKTDQALQELHKAKRSVSMVNRTLIHLEDSVKKKITKKGKEITDSIARIEELFFLPKEFNGYDHVTVRLPNKIYRAMSYNTLWGGPGANAVNAYNDAKNGIRDALEMINGFFDKPWKEYRELVESTEIPMFEDYHKIELD